MEITEWEIRRTAVGQRNIKIILCDDDPSVAERADTVLQMKNGSWIRVLSL